MAKKFDITIVSADSEILDTAEVQTEKLSLRHSSSSNALTALEQEKSNKLQIQITNGEHKRRIYITRDINTYFKLLQNNSEVFFVTKVADLDQIKQALTQNVAADKDPFHKIHFIKPELVLKYFLAKTNRSYGYDLFSTGFALIISQSALTNLFMSSAFSMELFKNQRIIDWNSFSSYFVNCAINARSAYFTPYFAFIFLKIFWELLQESIKAMEYAATLCFNNKEAEKKRNFSMKKIALNTGLLLFNAYVFFGSFYANQEFVTESLENSQKVEFFQNVYRYLSPEYFYTVMLMSTQTLSLRSSVAFLNKIYNNALRPEAKAILDKVEASFNANTENKPTIEMIEKSEKIKKAFLALFVLLLLPVGLYSVATAVAAWQVMTQQMLAWKIICGSAAGIGKLLLLGNSTLNMCIRAGNFIEKIVLGRADKKDFIDFVLFLMMFTTVGWNNIFSPARFTEKHFVSFFWNDISKTERLAWSSIIAAGATWGINAMDSYDLLFKTLLWQIATPYLFLPIAHSIAYVPTKIYNHFKHKNYQEIAEGKIETNLDAEQAQKDQKAEHFKNTIFKRIKGLSNGDVIQNQQEIENLQSFVPEMNDIPQKFIDQIESKNSVVQTGKFFANQMIEKISTVRQRLCCA